MGEDNPEASMQNNIIEMSTVVVKDWSSNYLPCNAPGAVYNGSIGRLDCPKTSPTYCCTGNKTEITAATLPGYEDRSRHGGGCSECGSDLDQCVAKCIQAALVTGFYQKDYSGLLPTWNKAFDDKSFCPDEPFPPSASKTIVVV